MLVRLLLHRQRVALTILNKRRRQRMKVHRQSLPTHELRIRHVRLRTFHDPGCFCASRCSGAYTKDTFHKLMKESVNYPDVPGALEIAPFSVHLDHARCFLFNNWSHDFHVNTRKGCFQPTFVIYFYIKTSELPPRETVKTF